MNRLNDYCLLHIFQYFNPKDRLNVSKVCRRWEFLTKTYWKEKKLTILDNCYVDNKENLCFDEIQEIITRCGPYLQDVSLIPICESVKKITFVQFGASRYSTTNFTTLDALEELSKTAFNISSLYIRFCCNKPTNLIKKLLHSNKKLTKLEIEGDYSYFENLINLNVLPESLEQISFSFIYFESDILCPFLQRITNLKKLKLIEGNLVTEQSLLTLTAYLTQLQALHLEEDVEEGCDISVTALESISKLVNIEELSIKGFVNTMVDSVLMKITLNCTKIKEFALSGCNRITDNGIVHALSYLQNLQVLELKNLSISELSNQKFASALKKLKIYRCGHLSTDALCNAIKASPDLSHFEIYSSRPISESVMFTAVTTAMSRNQKLIVTEDINSTEILQVTVYKSNCNDLTNKKADKPTFYFQCQPSIPDWLVKMKKHVSDTLPTCYVTQEIKQCMSTS